MKSAKIIKNLVSASVLSAFLSLGYTAFPVKKTFVVPEEQFLKDNKIEYTITDHLTLNMNPKKTLVTITTEAAAIEDIRYLAQKNVNEESWIQIPLKDNKLEYMFIEIGKGNRVYLLDGFIYSTIYNNVILIHNITKNVDSYLFFHDHPDLKLLYAQINKLKPEDPRTTNDISVNVDSTLLGANIFLTKLCSDNNYGSTLPSSIDLDLARIKSLFETNEKGLCDNNKIVSSQGISDFSITDAGKLLAKKGELKDYIGKKYNLLSSKTKLKFAGKYFKIEYNKHITSRDNKDDFKRELLFNTYALPYIK